MNKLLAENLRKEKIEKLITVVTRLIGPNRVSIEKDSIFVNLPHNKDGITFFLRINLDENFPLDPGDYIFVNPDTKNDDDPKFWPQDREQAFKVKNQNPRWICTTGTKAYKIRHHMYNPEVHSLAQTVVHIYRQINGVIRVE